MFTPDEEYEIITSAETDSLISDFPIELLKENLRYQIENPLSTDVNYLETIMDRYHVLKGDFGDNEDAMEILTNETMDFFNFVIGQINDKFELSLNVDMYDNLQDCIDGGMILYRFLVLRYRKNVTKYLTKFITKNKKSLIEEFEDDLKKKDVTTVASKKKNKNRDDALIIANLPNIISYIMSLEIEPLDFMKYIAGEDNFEASYITRLILEGNLMSNFVPGYLNNIVVDYRDIMDEIQTDVKMKLMKNK